jgi:predicted Rossmann fold flavoprotein
MCAAIAGKRGRSVVVIDHANKVGKKILMSGGGRCNFTNTFTHPSYYISSNPHFCKSALARFTQWDFIQLVQKHKIPHHEKKLGQLFCSDKAQDILNLLLDECAEASAAIYSQCSITSVTALDETQAPFRYSVLTNLGAIQCESLVVATGGLSIPTMGATGLGYQIAEQFGLPLIPRTAGLVPFTLTPAQLEQFSACVGNSAEVQITCGEHSFTEALLFTHRGLSGPAVLQISSCWQPGQHININLLPHLDLVEHLTEQQKNRPKALLATLMSELLTKNIAHCFCSVFHAALNQAPSPSAENTTRPINQYSLKELKLLAQTFQAWSLMPAGTEGYRTAEVTLGGVDVDYLSSKSMEAKQQKGLFFIGEVVDVTGHLGGFNFQWAWASGFAAAQFV